MDYVNLGRTGLQVSRICLGMMSYGNGSQREWVLDEDTAEPIAAVAAACATVAGGWRMRGHVTAVVMGSEVAWDRASITDHTCPLWPCSSSQGWKWPEIHSASKPASSASLACRTSSCGGYSSEDRK